MHSLSAAVFIGWSGHTKSFLYGLAWALSHVAFQGRIVLIGMQLNSTLIQFELMKKWSVRLSGIDFAGTRSLLKLYGTLVRISATVLRNPSADFALCALPQRCCIHQEFVIYLSKFIQHVFLQLYFFVDQHWSWCILYRQQCSLVEASTHTQRFLYGLAWPPSHVAFQGRIAVIGKQLISIWNQFELTKKWSDNLW